MRDEAARDGAAQHGVAVIKRSVDPTFFSAMKARAVQLHEIERSSLTFHILWVARADATGIGIEPVGAFAASEAQAGSLILDFAPDDVGPGLLGQWAGNVELQALQPVGARVRQER